jgi:hypothetical protein
MNDVSSDSAAAGVRFRRFVTDEVPEPVAGARVVAGDRVSTDFGTLLLNLLTDIDLT